MAHLDFERVKREVSIPRVLEEFGILGQFTERSGRLRGACPLPSHPHNPIKPNTEQWVADAKSGVWQWVCFSPDHGGKPLGGSVIELVMHLAELDDYKHVRLWFLERFPELGDKKRAVGTKKAGERHVGQERSDSPAVSKSTVSLPARPAGVKPLTWHYKLDPEVHYLLEERRLQARTIERFGIGLCRRGWLAGRIAIPLHWHDQKDGESPVSYLGRSCGEPTDGEAKYLFWHDFPRRHYIYGLREALQDAKPESPLVITEGPFDLYRCWEAGIPSVVATLGCNLTEEQAAVIRSTGRDVVLLFDGNAHEATRRALGTLASGGFIRVRACFLLDGSEPEHLSTEELLQLLPYR